MTAAFTIVLSSSRRPFIGPTALRPIESQIYSARLYFTSLHRTMLHFRSRIRSQASKGVFNTYLGQTGKDTERKRVLLPPRGPSSFGNEQSCLEPAHIHQSQYSPSS